MSKTYYTCEDFVLDLEFRNWILHNDRDSEEFWSDYLKQNPQKAKEIDQARQLIINISRKNFKLNKDEIELQWKSIESRLGPEECKIPTKVVSIDSWTAIKHYKEESVKRRKRVYLRTLALSVAVLAGLGIMLWVTAQKPLEELVPQEPKFEEIATISGVKSTVSLPDGSKVTLNSGSSIRFLKNFVQQTREIELSGEAFFDVVKDLEHPFYVTSKNLITKAVGTSFNIRAYPDEVTSVALVSGIVEVTTENKNDSKTLSPGESVELSNEENELVKSLFDIEEQLAWMNKTLIFKSTPLGKAIETMENWYGVDFIIQGEIPQELFVSGKFQDESLQNILDGLSFSSRLEYSIEGNKVNLQFKP
jgi:ferric-dicitrate binding protein FerR (iron transport regulator)